VRKALESPAITLETRQSYTDANVAGFKPPKHKSLEWWADKLEEIASRDDDADAEIDRQIAASEQGNNSQLDDLF
jgi:hypothetical protein